MRRPTATEVGYALLFSVPPGVGATAFALNLVGAAPVIYAFGGVLTVGLFVLVVVILTSGENAASPADG
jgi:hypothetical protein